MKGNRFVPYILTAVACSAIAALIFYGLIFHGGVFVGPSNVPSPPRFEFTYSDFVSFLLTVLAVILTALILIIGLVAFRTIAEIKHEARRIAARHSKSEVERALADVPVRVAEAVELEVKQRLPSEIDSAVEEAVKTGRMDTPILRAILQTSMGGGTMNEELQPEFEQQTGEGEQDA